MARVSRIQTNFTAGEVSPRLLGRVDLAKYNNAAETIENFIVHPHGGITRRPGTKFVAEVKDSSKATYLIPFEFSVTQAYVIEAGNLYFRFYKDQGRIETGAFAHAFVVAYIVSTAVEVATPYLEADIDELQFAQSADVLYITHASYAPRKLTRTSHTAWTLTVITFLDGPFQDENITTTTLTPSAATGSVTITASATVGINDGDGFRTSDIGRFIRIGHQASKWATSTAYAVGAHVGSGGNVYEVTKAGTSSSTATDAPTSDGDEIVEGAVTWKFLYEGGVYWGYANITAFTDTTHVTATVVNKFDGTSAEIKWRLGAWSTGTGFPATVAFFEQRLMFAGSTDQPQTLWGSKSGDYENFQPGTLDEDPVIYTIATDRVNVIRWLSPAKVMACGTAGGEFIVSSSTTAEPLTPTNVRIIREGTRGSHTHIPVRVDQVVIFIQRQKRNLREYSYVFESDAFQSPDLTILAEHITAGGITQIVYQQEPNSTIWAVRADGQLIGLTFMRDQQVVAWHRHKIGGSFGSTAHAVVEALAVIPATRQEELWMVAKRTVDGSTVRYVEFMTDAFNTDEGDTKSAAFFVDSGLSYSGSAASSLLGFHHLEGETVDILGNGSVYPTKTVTAGAVTVAPTVTAAAVGLNYVSDLKTLRVEAGSEAGTAQGALKRAYEVTFRFVDTLGARFGPNTTNLDTIQFRGGSDPMDVSPPLFTGDKTVKFRDTWGREGQVVARQDQPLPMTLVAIVSRIIEHDG
jgi:hypothetical protein